MLIKQGQIKVMNDILTERERQDNKWGEQNHQPLTWVPILGEEYGEMCEAVNETMFDNGPKERLKGGYDNIRKEAVQVAAVAMALVEAIDRNRDTWEGEVDAIEMG